jgi:hypothetical protein
MVPTECPVSRAFTSYVSLINNIYNYNKLIMESTSYFPKEYIYINNLNNYLEIRPNFLTVDLTPYGENKTSYIWHPNPNSKSTSFVTHSRTMDSNWGI